MAISLDDISFSYKKSPFPVFDGLFLKMESPGFHALFGPSGVGKTSLARIICGDITPDRGRVFKKEGLKILYTYNKERLPGWSSVGRHIERICPPDKNRLMHELMEVFGMLDLKDLRFSQLSMGQQNRVNLIRYLVQDFDLLIMDESLGNVDEATRERIILFIRSSFPDRIFLYISHNLLEVARFCNIIYVLGTPGSPQVKQVSGLGASGYHDRQRCERVMLEIMHVS